MKTSLSKYVAQQRKSLKLTQIELSERAGVGLRFIRDLEQGKKTLKTDKVNQVLNLFGQTLGPVPMDRENHD
jgi:y4mF family transcriptional regulator